MPQRIIHEEIPEFTQQEKLVYSGHVSSLQQNVWGVSHQQTFLYILPTCMHSYWTCLAIIFRMYNVIVT